MYLGAPDCRANCEYFTACFRLRRLVVQFFDSSLLRGSRGYISRIATVNIYQM